MSLFIEDAWAGSYYELAMEIAPKRNDDRLHSAVESLLGFQGIEGAWASREDLGKTPPHEWSLEQSQIGYCVVKFGVGTLGAVVHIVREENDGPDWLDLCVPTGMLEQVVPVQYPLTELENPWMAGLDRDLISVAEHVYRAVPFDLAIVGEECSGFTNTVEAEVEHFDKGVYLLSSGFAARMPLSREPKTLDSGLLLLA